jgi:hypothetical protein
MNPSVDIRIAAMIRVLDTIVVPALATGMARDQAMLIAGHLRVLRDQADFAVRFEVLEFCAAQRLGQDLLAILDGGEETHAAGAALAAAMRVGTSPDPKVMRKRHYAVTAAIEELVRTGGRDGTALFRKQMRTHVLRAAREESQRERNWFGGMGFESDPVKSLPQLMADFEAEYRYASAAPHLPP